MAYFSIREGVATFEQFVIFVRQAYFERKFFKSMDDAFTPEEWKGIKSAWEQGNSGVTKGGGLVDDVLQGAGNWGVFPKINMKITSIDADGWLMGKYINGELQVIGNTNVAQKWDYIVKVDGQILVGRKHSWLSQGDRVLAAGELKYNNGKLVEISNASGHYRPSTTEASNFLRIFRQAGVKVDDVTLTILKNDGTIFKQIPPTSGDRLTYY